MRAYDQGAYLRVAVGEGDVEAFADRWPCSGLRGLRGVTFLFEKGSGNLVDIWYKNGTSERWDGPALVALSEDAQSYGKERVKP